MVGHETLDLGVLVRIQVGQPFFEGDGSRNKNRPFLCDKRKLAAELRRTQIALRARRAIGRLAKKKEGA